MTTAECPGRLLASEWCEVMTCARQAAQGRQHGGVAAFICVVSRRPPPPSMDIELCEL
jgi:hypothetical protein